MKEKIFQEYLNKQLSTCEQSCIGNDQRRATCMVFSGPKRGYSLSVDVTWGVCRISEVFSSDYVG